MSFRRLVLAISLIAVFAIGLRMSVDTDTYWHLAAGRWMVERRQLLQRDVFSHTMAAQPWVNHSWLSQLLLFGVHEALGLPGLNLLTALLAVAGLAILWAALEGAPLAKGFVTVLAASTAAVFWSARPQMLTFVAVAGYVLILERWRRRQPSPLWALPLIMLLWANLHGGFAAGFLLIFAYLVGEWLVPLLAALTGKISLAQASHGGWDRTRPLVMAAVGASLVTMINPAGPRLLLIPFETISIGALQDYIQEWQSPNFHQPQLLPFAAMLLLSAAAMAASGGKVHPTEIVLFVGVGYMALSAARNISLFALAVSPPLARHGQSALAPLSDRLRDRSELPPRLLPLLNGTLIALVTIAVGLWSAPRLTKDFAATREAERVPVAAVDHIQSDRPPKPILNSYDWGGYLIWRLWPEYRSFVDGRTDLYGDAFLQDYLQLWRAEGNWQRQVRKYGFESALLEPGAPLVTSLESEGWRTAYRDGQAVLLIRSSAR